MYAFSYLGKGPWYMSPEIVAKSKSFLLEKPFKSERLARADS